MLLKKVKSHFSPEHRFKEEILVNHYTSKCLSSSEQLVDPNHEHNVIVSLTTYSHRIDNVYLAIESIGQQTIKANAIVLWLDEDEFTLETLPETLKKQMKRGLDVRFTSNSGSYKKLFPSISHFPDKHIITIDDDILYSYDMIERLLRGHNDAPSAIIGCRAHEIVRDVKTGMPKPYKEWLNEIDSDASLNTFITTGGGTLFPADESRELLNQPDKAMQHCPNADDVWVNYMARLNNLNVIKLSLNTPYRHKFTFLSQSVGAELKQQNVEGGKNDVYLESLRSEYGKTI
ncbi:glycosyltransferase family 2 protein [Vibrio sp. 404]|uniref:Glycosyltransferase family 2 protein n=2 Tax=Vibrio marinisediminis TaxID=2758441 RepID=A0A7W2IU92_9VIBR|nr:glycosyltransferase family 2 protein [Vibrio marinisediminis]